MTDESQLPKQPKYEPFTEEKAKEIIDQINTILDKNDGQFITAPIINSNGTLGSKVELVKRVSEDVETPYLDGAPTDGKEEDNTPKSE